MYTSHECTIHAVTTIKLLHFFLRLFCHDTKQFFPNFGGSLCCALLLVPIPQVVDLKARNLRFFHAMACLHVPLIDSGMSMREVRARMRAGEPPATAEEYLLRVRLEAEDLGDVIGGRDTIALLPTTATTTTSTNPPPPAHHHHHEDIAS